MVADFTVCMSNEYNVINTAGWLMPTLVLLVLCVYDLSQRGRA